MKTTLFFLLILISFSCRKKEEIKPIDILYHLKDDVSPVIGEFSIPGEYDYINWTFEGIYFLTDYDLNPAHYNFTTEGIASVEVTAIKYKTLEKFIGKTEVKIPGSAKRLNIKGLFFKNLESGNPYNQKQLYISITYQKLGTTDSKIILINPAEYSTNDTIFFPDPIIYNVNGFEEGNGYDHDIYITINANQEENLTFRSNFNLTTINWAERPLNPDYVQLFNGYHNNIDQIFLLCDWMPK